MDGARLASFRTADGIRAGVVVDDRVYAAGRLPGNYLTMQALLDDWSRALSDLRAFAAAPHGPHLPLRDVDLAAPLPRPPAIYCAGANYRDHSLNMARIQNLPPEPDPHELGLGPWHFMKSGSVVVGPDAAVENRAERLDWEAELAVIIGVRGRDIPPDRALAHVAGYSVANDLSARDRVRRNGVSDQSPFKYDWIGHKNFDGSCPLGPWIVPADDIADPQDLGIRLWVNDVVKQSSSSSEMIFTVAEQISHLSRTLTLHPGDVILTGTPAGTGTEHGERLGAGDVVRIEIEGIGELVTHIA